MSKKERFDENKWKKEKKTTTTKWKISTKNAWKILNIRDLKTKTQRNISTERYLESLSFTT